MQAIKSLNPKWKLHLFFEIFTNSGVPISKRVLLPQDKPLGFERIYISTFVFSFPLSDTLKTFPLVISLAYYSHRLTSRPSSRHLHRGTARAAQLRRLNRCYSDWYHIRRRGLIFKGMLLSLAPLLTVSKKLAKFLNFLLSLLAI